MLLEFHLTLMMARKSAIQTWKIWSHESPRRQNTGANHGSVWPLNAPRDFLALHGMDVSQAKLSGNAIRTQSIRCSPPLGSALSTQIPISLQTSFSDPQSSPASSLHLASPLKWSASCRRPSQRHICDCSHHRLANGQGHGSCWLSSVFAVIRTGEACN